jgi:F0F1-type ATP synthase membrane subunit c/vacuolar-type H+-ATPase subunit K
MGWIYFLAGLFVGNLAAFVAIALAQSARRGEEAMAASDIYRPVNDSAS